MISKETVMKMANVLNLTVLKEYDRYAVFNYKNVEVCAMSWSPTKLSYIHNFIEVSTEVTFTGDKVDSGVKIYWGGTTFIDIFDGEQLTDFINRTKQLCENVDKAITVSKQMTSASKIAVIKGE